MRRFSLVCLLLGAFCWAQTQAAAPLSPAAKKPEPSSAAKSIAVITISGLCVAPETRLTRTTSGKPCRARITREEFEKLANAIQPDMTPLGKRQLADSLPRLLVMAHAAEQLGLDRQDHFQEMLAYARLQILSEDLLRHLQQNSAAVPAKEIEDYYRQHAASFERITFQRVFVPIVKQAQSPGNQATPPSPETVAVSHQQMAQAADLLHQRAARGEDFAVLQQAAYDTAGITAPIPKVKLASVRRGSLPASHLSVFDLEPGGISALISDSTGHYIYKLDSKEVESLAEAREEIHAVLQKQRMNEMMKHVQESATVEVNPAYFGTITVPESPTPAELAKPVSDPD